MRKLKLAPVANAKKLNRNELKNIFGGDVYGSSDKGSGTSCGCPNNLSVTITNCIGTCRYNDSWFWRRDYIVCEGPTNELKKYYE